MDIVSSNLVEKYNMPYRRLPNTDQTRIRAIKTALEKGRSVKVDELSLSIPVYEKLQFFYPRLTRAVNELSIVKKIQFDRSAEYAEIVKKAKLYITHFMQVLTFSIQREELKPETRSFYGLDPETQKIPSLSLENDIIKWGKNVIKGEKRRLLMGGNPIYCPSAALVRVYYESFMDAYSEQKVLQKNTDRAYSAINEIRKEADLLIQNTWNEIEDYFSEFSEGEKRKLSAEYGVVYVYRPQELKKIKTEKRQSLLTNLDSLNFCQNKKS